MNTERIKIKPSWNKTKEEIWQEWFEDLPEETAPTVKRKSLAFTFLRYAAAVAFVFTAGITAIGYNYTKQIDVPRGENRTLFLPDGSRVTLNAESTLHYKPLWWHMTRREVQLEGEGYFEVTPGSTFTVHSTGNEVHVLGTSFNVFARDTRYQVSCITGKVQVTTPDNKYLLTPGMGMSKTGDAYRMLSGTEALQSIRWTTGHFYFLATPLAEVIEEIERQYNIRVITNDNMDYLYSGNFSGDKSVEEILEIIGVPFGIRFIIK